MIATLGALTLADLHLAQRLYGGELVTDANTYTLRGALVAGQRVNFGPVAS